MIRMNMQNLMAQAKKMQSELIKIQNDLEKNTYEGKSQLVTAVVNGKKEIVSVKIDSEADFSNEDIELLEDMIMVAVNDAISKAERDKETKLGKYNQGFSGLF